MPLDIVLNTGGIVPVIATHSTQVRGAKEYAKQLDSALSEIKYVRLLNVRNSHIRSGRRKPKAIIENFSVIVHYFNDGSMQRLGVVPRAGVTLPELKLAVSAWIAANPPQ